MKMFNPPHPGETIKDDCLKPLGLSVTDAARGLGINRTSLSAILNGHTGISAEMALRLEAVGWGVAEGWVGMQTAHDLWQARQAGDFKAQLKPFAAFEQTGTLL